MHSRPLCSLGDLLEDLTSEGIRNPSERRILEKILAASEFIERRARGAFIPTLGTRTYNGDGDESLLVDPLLEITAITVDDVAYAVRDVVAQPLNRLWPSGPAMRLQAAPMGALANMPYGTANIVVTGKWGLYDGREQLAATVVAIDALSNVLHVSSGSEITPGCVLLIGDEQMVVIATLSATESGATLGGMIDDQVEEITLSLAGKVSIGEVIQLGFEQAMVLDIAGTSLSVQRGWRQTKRVEHAVGTPVMVQRTYAVERGINGTLAAAHVGAAISRVVAPDDIEYLARQMATLMIRKAESGYSGRVGNAETGETFYYNEFPKSQIEAVLSNYFLPYL